MDWTCDSSFNWAQIEIRIVSMYKKRFIIWNPVDKIIHT